MKKISGCKVMEWKWVPGGDVMFDNPPLYFVQQSSEKITFSAHHDPNSFNTLKKSSKLQG